MSTYKTIPFGFGAGSARYSGEKTNQNYTIMIREGNANAPNYNADNAHTTLVYDDGLQEAYLYYISDARGFETAAELVSPGLLPSESGRAGQSNMGSGLVFTGSSSCNDTPQIAIASLVTKTDEHGKKVYDAKGKEVKVWAAARTDINYDKDGRSWKAMVDDSVLDTMKRHIDWDALGKKRAMQVIYQWKLPYKTPSERLAHKKTEVKKEDGTGKITKTLQLTNENLTDLAFETGDNLGRFNFIYNQSIVEIPHHKPYNFEEGAERGSTIRRVPGKTEYLARYIDTNHRWSYNSEVFDVEMGERVFRFKARHNVYYSDAKTGDADRGRLQTITDNSSGQVFKGGHAWRKGATHREGYIPHAKLYLKMSCFDVGDKTSVRNPYARFSSDALYKTTSVKPHLLKLGCNYEPLNKQKKFAIMEIDVHEFLGEVVNDKLVSTSINWLDEFLGRRPDFLINDEKAKLIVHQAVEFAKPNVPQSMKEHFAKEFPWEEHDVVPLYLETASASTMSGGLCEVFDMVTGNRHDSKFNCGKVKYLAIYHRSTKTFLDNVKVHPKTRGVTIENLNRSHIARTKKIKPKFKKKLATNLLVLATRYAVRIEDLNIIRVTVSKLKKKDPCSKTFTEFTDQNQAKALYKADMDDKVQRSLWYPTSRVRIELPEDTDRGYGLGRVMEVPARNRLPRMHSGGTWSGGETGVPVPTTCDNPVIPFTGGKCDKVRSQNPFCERDPKVMLEFHENELGHHFTSLNKNHPRWADFLYRDKDGTPTQKLCNHIYRQVHMLAEKIGRCLMTMESLKVGPVANMYDYDEESRTDYPINDIVESMINSGWLEDEFLKLRKLREGEGPSSATG